MEKQVEEKTMVEFTTQIIKSGRATIPCKIRELFKLAEGDYVCLAFIKKLPREA